MILGPRLVVTGTILGAVFLSLFLFVITAGASYPPSLPAINAAAKNAQGQAMAVSKENMNASGRGCRVSDRFPSNVLQWCELITQYADKHSLSPDLVAALILQESNGDPAAYSRSGAVGLMQVMPSDGLASTFMCTNGPCFSNRPSVAQLQDAEYNISYGTKMLASLLARYGDIREALKNYGPMNVGYSYADRVLGLFQQSGREPQ
jgi:soluble lytic murein transglycosylase-like protein